MSEKWDRRRQAVRNYNANGGNMKQAMLDAGYSLSYAESHSNTLRKLLETQEKTNSEKILSVPEIQAWWSRNVKDESLTMGERIKCSDLLIKSFGGFLDNGKGSVRRLEDLL